MSEQGESYDPGPWEGYDYKSARAKYTPADDMDYGTPKSKAKSSASASGMASVKAPSIVTPPKIYVPDSLVTQAKSPLVIICDGTGSMGDFPEWIKKKLPLLDLGINDYVEDCEFSVAIVGDAECDSKGLQVQGFTKGIGLVDVLKNLEIEGGGGSNECESYDLAALYYARKVEMPKAVTPVLIYIADEGVYSTVNHGWAKKWAHVDLDKTLRSTDLFEELKKKFSVYCIRKHYGNQVKNDAMYGSNLKIHHQWENLIGADRIAILNDPQRVVDVIFGLLAYETNKVDFFTKELEDRQMKDKDGPEKIAIVQKSMLTIGHEPSKHTGKSIVVRDKGEVKRAKSLL